MIKILEESQKDLVALKVSGKITEEDYDILLPYLEKQIEKYGELRMYIELAGLDEVEPKAIWEDLKFDVKHINDFKKIAVVGNRDWEKGLTEISKLLTAAETKFFNRSDRNLAMKWL